MSNIAPPSSADFVVIGAGFVGAATAFHLARLAAGSRVVLLEREGAAAVHSSGRNAGMIRQVTSEEAVSELARKGAEAIRLLAEAAPAAAPSERPLFLPTGSVLVAAGEKAAQLERDIAHARAAGIPVERLDAAPAKERFPALRDASFELACHAPSDGVVDLPALARRYLERARSLGVEAIFGAGVEAIRTRGGRVTGVRAGGSEIETRTVVDAAGAWASEVAELAGAARIPLRPRRRHIFVTESLPWVPPDWPFHWDIATEVYFRPEEGGLLLSPCDEADPGNKRSDAADPAACELLRAKLSRQFPRLADLPVRRAWSGLRTLSPDGRFVLGPDPEVEGFFWAAGLGGHGVTASSSAGEIAATLVLDPGRDASNPHSPSRFR
ncbi:MAG: NAD(P)/FAD-dependent oxidoreductase [Planctomycetota bacterium]